MTLRSLCVRAVDWPTALARFFFFQIGRCMVTERPESHWTCHVRWTETQGEDDAGSQHAWRIVATLTLISNTGSNFIEKVEQFCSSWLVKTLFQRRNAEESGLQRLFPPGRVGLRRELRPSLTLLSFDPLRPMSVQQTVKKSNKEFTSVPPKADWTTCRETLRKLPRGKKHRASLLRVREESPSTHEPTVETKHCGPSAFVLPAYTVACARSPAGRQLPPRHPKTARALQITMPRRTASLPPTDAEWPSVSTGNPPCKQDKPKRGRNGVSPAVADALSFDATEGPGAWSKQHRTHRNRMSRPLTTFHVAEQLHLPSPTRIRLQESHQRGRSIFQPCRQTQSLHADRLPEVEDAQPTTHLLRARRNVPRSPPLIGNRPERRHVRVLHNINVRTLRECQVPAPWSKRELTTARWPPPWPSWRDASDSGSSCAWLGTPLLRRNDELRGPDLALPHEKPVFPSADACWSTWARRHPRPWRLGSTDRPRQETPRAPAVAPCLGIQPLPGHTSWQREPRHRGCTLAYIFPGQLEHKTPLVLLGVSGPGLRGTAAISPPFHNIGAPSFNTLAHKTPSARRCPWPPAAINFEGIASGPKARPDLGLERTWRASSHSRSVPGNAHVSVGDLVKRTGAACLSACTVTRCAASLNSAQFSPNSS